ncbi:IQ motif and ankyrin repeat domain-containing protein 1 [Erpetoichthys calabaricus]|uniref:IQ motif and ankyrin repeat domain-containing protein 1 n=1 Tax=Erpetoichthys calabaricus TaxID=27687 RepID=UPI0010A07EB1|nr:IQ motif and ankyrin repeat domain-containing protein 1 [Erpetoichthys calabaricus]
MSTKKPNLPSKGTTKAPGKQVNEAKKAAPSQRSSKKNSSSQKVPTKQKAEKKAASKKEVSLEDKAALVIQCAFRQHLARKELANRRKKKQEYKEIMDRLQKEAFVEMVRREQQLAEQERRKLEEERKKKLEEEKRNKRFLDAAFEGEVGEILAILKEVAELDLKNGTLSDDTRMLQRLRNRLNIINCADANGNTPLSEAAAGGHPEAITLLIENGADINTKGAFGRTPLYRAAFGGHLRAVQTLLQFGADPRIYANDASTPEQVSSFDSVVKTLRDWDISITESMLEKMEAEKQRREAEERKQKKAATDRIKTDIERLSKEYDRYQKEFQKAYCELNKRIYEHDKCELENKGKTKITLQAIQDAEAQMEKCRVTLQRAEEQLSLARLDLREETGSSSNITGITCALQELDDVLFKDVGNKLEQDGRWPLIIDPFGQAATFLRYRDTNYLDALNPKEMQPDVLRLALLGAIRFGKPLVINMMDVNAFGSVENQFNMIESGLMEQLLTKQILQNERYLSLIRPSDGPLYLKTEFRAARTDKFKLFFVTKLKTLQETLTALCPIEVVNSRKT